MGSMRRESTEFPTKQIPLGKIICKVSTNRCRYASNSISEESLHSKHHLDQHICTLTELLILSVEIVQ